MKANVFAIRSVWVGTLRVLTEVLADGAEERKRIIALNWKNRLHTVHR